ncbi:MAG TPA: 4-hydroxythreonine-4-phosphate dehydrogenase PdxA [Acetobacteraceae bacterium]|jgi:4-hydroxythreonine-4-phosphate dehydrogenase|nr:4-hydroxythreonine-4-phosphate dehydrogenase PdxA [Acetobacteraceae bacterium]
MRPLALTMGDPAGIGGELTLRAWQAWRSGVGCFVAVDDPDRLRRVAQDMCLNVPVTTVSTLDAVPSLFRDALPVWPISLAVPVRPGQPDPKNAAAVIASIEQATALALQGRASAVVTNPINKAALYDAGFPYPGHTEFLAALTGATGKQIMMLASPALRVVPVTVHASLQRSIQMITSERIVVAARTTAAALQQDFGIAAPRLAIAGLNPHAGEQGALGDEETTIIGPAIDELRGEGLDVSGPWPPDTMFTAMARARYDVAICMYHDQALIPLKTLDMTHGVNVTLGLPIVRTSPDHGTAYDIAGRGIADPSSLIAALEFAAQLAARRVAAAVGQPDLSG